MSLLDLWHDHPRIVELRQALQQDHCVGLEGVTASAPAFILATLVREHPYLVIAEDADSSDHDVSLTAYGGNVFRTAVADRYGRIALSTLLEEELSDRLAHDVASSEDYHMLALCANIVVLE